MTRESAAQRLAIMWFVLPLPATALLTMQTLAGKYGDDTADAWNWLVAQFAPILALILAAAFSNPTRSWRQKPANKFRWRCAAGTSLLQASTVLALLLVEPVLASTSFQVFDATGWLLALLQGVVVACIGAVVFDGR